MALDPLLVGVPTHDGRAMITSITALSRVGNILDRPVVFLIGEASNIPRSRNLVMDEARSRAEVKESAFILWMDSDIMIPASSVPAIVQAIMWSHDTQQNWAAHYRMATGDSVLIAERSRDGARHYTMDELNAMDNFSSIAMGGMGLSYICMPMDYVFHADVVGEDVNFFLDCPTIDLHYAKEVKIFHRKTVIL